MMNKPTFVQPSIYLTEEEKIAEAKAQLEAIKAAENEQNV